MPRPKGRSPIAVERKRRVRIYWLWLACIVSIEFKIACTDYCSIVCSYFWLAGDWSGDRTLYAIEIMVVVLFLLKLQAVADDPTIEYVEHNGSLFDVDKSSNRYPTCCSQRSRIADNIP